MDEIGRGTSTYDGVSIAWAVVEYIHKDLEGARALFATHYHELTELASIMRGIKNYHLAVKEYITPEQFDRYAEMAKMLGFENVASAPMVRSSYHADLQAKELT